MTTPEGRGDRLQAALRDFAGGAPPGPSAWQRLLPAPLEDPALAAIEAALDEPALAAELARLEAEESYPASVLERLRALGLADFFAGPRATFWHASALNSLT